jgi:hypothetical protein
VKNRPKYGPADFLLKIYAQILPWKKVAKGLGLFV